MVAETRFYALQDFAHPALRASIAQHFRVSGGIDLGHSYKAKRQENGNYTLLDVDIFKACERKNAATGKIDQFNDEWMQGAQARFEELKRTGYLPPCHLDHHGKDGFSQPDAGKIGAMRIGKDAAGVSTLFADIVDIPAEVFAKMVRGRLSYRSVEVNNPDVKEISSLAFMATTVPYHKLPILQVDLDESAATFSDAPQGRALFAELYSLDPKQPHLSIVQKFYGDYGGYDQPTAAMQRMARRPMQQDPRGGFGGMQDDGDDDQDDIQISDDDLAQLLPLMQQQQGQGMQQPAQSMPGDMQGDPLEEMMGNPQLAQALMTTLQGIDQKMDAVLKGAANPAPSMPTPNPVASAQPKTNAVAFAEPAAGADLQTQLTAANAQIKNLTELVNHQGNLIYTLFAENKRGEMASFFRRAAAPHSQAFFADLQKQAKFTEANADAYMDQVDARFHEKMSAFIDANIDLALSGKPEANDWQKADVNVFFANERKALNLLEDAAARATFAEPKTQTATTPVAQGGSAAPRSTTEAAKIAPITDADVKTFLDAVNPKDRASVVRAFAEHGEAAKTALTDAKGAWAKMTPQQQQFHDGFSDYAAKMVYSANNGAAMHG